MKGGRLKVLRNEALQRRRVRREDGESEDPPGGGDEARGEGLKGDPRILSQMLLGKPIRILVPPAA